MSDNEVLSTLQASAPRRWFAVVVLCCLGVFLIVLAFGTGGAGFGYQAFLMIFGALALLEARRLWRATEQVLELTREGLRIRDGALLVALDEIEQVDRGVFAFKPSNGFLLRTKAKGPHVWAPGMYWRVGRRIGIGGVTTASQAKFMAEIISALLAERHASSGNSG